jgi:hypothetical protein
MNKQQAAIHQNYGCAQAIQQGLVNIAFSQVALNSKMPWEGAVALIQRNAKSKPTTARPENGAFERSILVRLNKKCCVLVRGIISWARERLFALVMGA